jgi:hypothetical protein
MASEEIGRGEVERSQASYVHVGPIPSILVEQLIAKQIRETGTASNTKSAFAIHDGPLEDAIRRQDLRGVLDCHSRWKGATNIRVSPENKIVPLFHKGTHRQQLQFG